jgi:hypothetical protein
LKKEIEEAMRTWKDYLCPWISTVNIVKMAKLPKIHMEAQKTLNSQNNPEQKD